MDQVEAELHVDATESIRWSVLGGTVSTALNEPYLIRVDVESEQMDADPLALLGSASHLIIRRGLSDNVYGGVVSSVRVNHQHGRNVRASLQIEPALAALRNGRDTRIFQNKTVPTVLEEVLTEALAPYGRTALVDLTRAYPEREYTVQYQESDFDFVHRLMEEEGILYYFAAGDGGVEQLVLVDAPQQHPSIEDEAVLEYAQTVAGDGVIGEEYLHGFEPVSTVVGTEVVTRHFDWTHPAQMVEGGEDAAREGGNAPNGATFGPARESYEHEEPLTLHEYSTRYRANDVGDQPRVRRERQARDALKYVAHGSVTRIRAGVRFDLNGHPSIDLNASYVVVGATHRIGSHRERGEDSKSHYGNRFHAIPADVAYRPRRVRPRPRVHGIQTAFVTGPEGEEIHTDEHGRVKVQFHWDRVGQRDDRTTCWIRCMQSWAGPGWGAWILPRVGMEVVVSFIDGDLDRPLVTGCVYNGDFNPPYGLPEKKMVSTFKTNSYPGGDGYNELRFDDTKNAEEIWMHGEKDWNTVIEHDLDRTVHNDERQTVDKNRTRMVGLNESVKIGVNQNVAVVANQITAVGVNRVVKVGAHKIVNAGETIDLRCGKSRIVMNKQGVIRIEGTELRFGASNEVWVAGKLIHLN